MDPETQDLVVQLCTRAGMIMEDTSPLAITNLPDPGAASLQAQLRTLQTASDTIAALIEAASVLVRAQQAN